MREIKFRGKRVGNGEWVYGWYIKAKGHWNNKGIHEDWIICHAIQNGGWFALGTKYPVIPETVGQFTGLHDNTGKEIYEGDVMKSVTYRYVGEVKYVPENAAFLVFWSDDKGRHTDYLDDGMCSLIEVIGNIHDKAGDE